LIAYLIASREAVTDIWRQQTMMSLGCVAATVYVQWFLGAYRDSLLLRCLSHNVRWSRLHELNAYQLALNSLPFRMGTVYKAKRLKSDHGVPYSELGSALLVQSVVVIAGGGVIASWVLLTHSFADGADARWLGIACLAISLALVGAVWIPFPSSPRLPVRVHRFIASLHAGLKTVRRSRAHFIGVFGLSILCFLLQSLRLYVLLNSVDSGISFSQSLVYAAMAQISMVLSITPSALGIREVLFGLVSRVTGQSLALGVVTAVFERVFVLLCASVVILVSVSHRFRARVAELD
ncbi:MAG: lysylphosphatidylglycerol synthase transmembrane domain-containing protein, partial [Planctomycetota bacterium]